MGTKTQTQQTQTTENGRKMQMNTEIQRITEVTKGATITTPAILHSTDRPLTNYSPFTLDSIKIKNYCCQYQKYPEYSKFRIEYRGL